ncbi:MAG: SAM-dependent methyltransferase [Alphaproteobacteria bacterium]|nr:SAM-dependent methyltransferase [Alphaproteobacteria bacterium]
MSATATPFDAALRQYLLAVGVRESPAQVRLREATASDRLAIMQITPEQGAFMALLVELMGVRRYLEIGVYTGYSTLSVAQAMGPEGRITALDVSEEWTRIAWQHWTAAGLAHKIDLRLVPALDSLAHLRRDPGPSSYDLAFIDADKVNYPAYYEVCLELVRPGGLVAIDNAFMMGRVLEAKEPGPAAIDRVNRSIRDDARVSIAMLPLGDGLMLARKR